MLWFGLVSLGFGWVRCALVRLGRVWCGMVIFKMPFYRFSSKKFFISFSDAQKIVNFPLLNGNLVARKENWAFDIFNAEKKVESKLHHQLKKKSISYFKKAGYRVNQTPVGVKNVKTLSDYFIVKNNQFYFVECLTPKLINPRVISKKLKLAGYAPLWFVVAKGTNLDAFPKEANVKILIL